MPAHVQISLLRRMPLVPGGAVMALSAILLTTSELTSPFIEHDIQIKLLTDIGLNTPKDRKKSTKIEIG